MYAKKSLGQHFLKSEGALKKIIETAKLDEDDVVLEIGPGTGILTKKLLETGAKVLAVEKDDELFNLLEKTFANEIAGKKLILVHGDILDFKPKNYRLESRQYKLVANIPYNITGVVIKKFLTEENQPREMVLLVQKEVAERIVASPRHGGARNGKESLLSLSIKAYGEPKYIETVKAGSFVPVPKVDSAIIAVENISKNFFSSAQGSKNLSEKSFFALLQAGFKTKRKKLSSNLSVILEKKRVLEAMAMLDIGENTRAEDLNLETWQKLAQNLI